MTNKNKLNKESRKIRQEIGAINRTEGVSKKRKKELVDNFLNDEVKKTLDKITKNTSSRTKRKTKKTAEEVSKKIKKASEEEIKKAVELLEKWKKERKLDETEADIMYIYLDEYGEQYLPNSISRAEIGKFIKWLRDMYLDQYYLADDFEQTSSNDNTPTGQKLQKFWSLNTILDNVSFDE